MGQIIIEPATREVLPDLLRIEEACFSAPWTRKMFEAELSGNKFAHFLIARQAEEKIAGSVVLGYLCYWVVFEEMRLMNLAIVEAARRRGIATTLVSHALSGGLMDSATRAMLEVRHSNTAACAFYERMGFRRVALRTRYYTSPVEDAVLMELEPIIVKPFLSLASMNLEVDESVH